MSYRNLNTLIDPSTRSGNYVIAANSIVSDFDICIVEPDALRRIFTSGSFSLDTPQYFFVAKKHKFRSENQMFYNDYKLLEECLSLGRLLIEKVGIISAHDIVKHLNQTPVDIDVIKAVIDLLNKYGLPWCWGDRIDWRYAERRKIDASILLSDDDLRHNACSFADIYVSFTGLFFYWTLWHSSIHGIAPEEANNAFSVLSSYMHGRYRLIENPPHNLSVALDSRLYPPYHVIYEGAVVFFGPNTTLSRGVRISNDGNPMTWFESYYFFNIAYCQLQELIVTNAITARLCKKCGKPFSAKGTHSQYCDECGPLSPAERTKRHRARKKAADFGE